MIDHGRARPAVAADAPESTTIVNGTKPFRATFHSIR